MVLCAILSLLRVVLNATLKLRVFRDTAHIPSTNDLNLVCQASGFGVLFVNIIYAEVALNQ